MKEAKNNKHRIANIGYLIIGFLGVFVLANMLVSSMSEGLVLPGVTIAGENVGLKSKPEVRKILDRTINENKINIKSGNDELVTTPAELGLSYDLDSTVESAYKAGRYYPIPLLGIMTLFRDGKLGYSYQVDSKIQNNFLNNKLDKFTRAPENAVIKVTDGNVEIVPDKEGYRLDKKKLVSQAIALASQGKGGDVVLEPIRQEADFTISDAQNVKPEIEKLLDRKVVLTYEGKVYEPSRKDKGYWLTFNYSKNNDGSPKMDIGLSREQIQGYLQSVANQLDVPAKNKKVSVRNGTSTVTQEGQDGKSINQASAVDEIVNNFKNKEVAVSLISATVPYTTETNNSVGPEYAKYIEVNLSSQSLWAYENNVPVFSTSITSGATGAGFGTVTGLFNIYAKETGRYLNGQQYGYNYNVYVDYWMPFYSGYGLHDADWRSSFGGPDYYYNGSHGCVNMPKSSAAFLYGWTSIGTPVWIHY